MRKWYQPLQLHFPIQTISSSGNIVSSSSSLSVSRERLAPLRCTASQLRQSSLTLSLRAWQSSSAFLSQWGEGFYVFDADEKGCKLMWILLSKLRQSLNNSSKDSQLHSLLLYLPSILPPWQATQLFEWFRALSHSLVLRTLAKTLYQVGSDSSEVAHFDHWRCSGQTAALQALCLSLSLSPWAPCLASVLIQHRRFTLVCWLMSRLLLAKSTTLAVQRLTSISIARTSNHH